VTTAWGPGNMEYTFVGPTGGPEGWEPAIQQLSRWLGKASPRSRGGRSRLMAFCGSSTVEKCFIGNRPDGTSTQSMAHANNGFMGHVQMRHGSPFAYAKSGILGMGGVVTGPASTANTVCWQVEQALALTPAITDILIMPMGNDDLSVVSVDQIWAWVRDAIIKCFKKDVRVWLVYTHLTPSKNVHKQKFLDFHARVESFAKMYPGSISIVDQFTGLLGSDGLADAAYLLPDLTHLNVKGVRKASFGWDPPLASAGLAYLPVDAESFGDLITSTPVFTNSQGQFTYTPWSGSGGFSSLSESPDLDPWGRRAVRVTQLTPGTVASFRQTFTPVGNACIARMVFAAKAVQNCRVIQSDLYCPTWSISDLGTNRDGDTTSEFLPNGEWFNFISAEIAVPSGFFVANAQMNIRCNQLATDPPAIMDVSCAGLVKVADIWP
jgi:hypothetical protein